MTHEAIIGIVYSIIWALSFVLICLISLDLRNEFSNKKNNWFND
jgi:hypothetical protein